MLVRDSRNYRHREEGMDEVRLALHGLGKLNTGVADDIIWIVKRAFEPLALEAGQTLHMTRGPSLGDLNITLDSKEPPKKPCQYNWLGEDGSQIVYALVHKDWRVCGPEHHGHRDMRRFMSNDRRLGRALANAAIHELGHYIADLQDVFDASNYMITGDLPKDARTRSSQREFFAGHKSFTVNQRNQIVSQLRKREWLGDFNSEWRPQ
jgi:hypothetical protein